MTATQELLRRHVDPNRTIPDAAPVGFLENAGTVAPEQVATDMGDLASRVRALMALQQQSVLTLPLGGHFFDVVLTASGAQAHAAVAVMDGIQRSRSEQGAACGPVVEDPHRSWLIWLVPPGTSDQWQPHRYATCLGRPHSLALPAVTATKPPGPYWLRPFRGDRLVPVAALRSLLDQCRPGPAPYEAVIGSMLTTIS
ncbi:hypothetical protein [Streptomyces griseoaurantiacus]|uniref:hypothetical protein n=1 Tax=Streptomyces griseoaurantiacus TaxID=68213 RepID=UPI0030E429FE